MATNTLNTRIVLKNDTKTNWDASTLKLLKGEVAIEFDPAANTAKLKIGDGDDSHTYADLPYVTMTPDEISDLVKAGAVNSVSLAPGTNNGTLKLVVDGTVYDNIAVKGIGADSAAFQSASYFATKTHGTHVEFSAAAPKANGTANPGTATTVAKSDHVHPLQTSVNSATTATKLSTARTFSLTGQVTGSVSSDLSSGVSINTTVMKDSHHHTNDTIDGIDASKIKSGTISIDRLPQGALERCVIVADKTARLALTTSSVQVGDTVKETDSGLMYFVIDDTKLNSEDGYTIYTAGSATAVPWNGVTGKPATFPPSSHTHSKSQITDFPAALKNPSALTISLNGTSQGAYDGSAAKSINITPENLGAAAATHGIHVTFSTANPAANGTASPGNSSTVTVAKSDHVHPLQSTVSGNAGTASKLQNTQTIDGIAFNGASPVNHYSTCSTAAGTAEKAAACSNFSLTAGARITVRFTVTNTAANPTLNVNGTGAKPVYYRGSAIAAGYLAANRTYTFVYNGTQYELVGDINTDTNTDTKVTNTLATTTKAYVTGTTSAATSTGTQVFDTGVYLDTTAGQLVATTFKGTNVSATNITGNLTGNVTGNVTGSSGSCTGNAATASSAAKLTTARSIALSGGATATPTTFNGTANISIPVTALNTDFLKNGSNTLILDCGSAT